MMELQHSNYWINSMAHIANGRAFRNNQCITEEKGVDIDSFLVSLYRQLQLDYPKWYKMDRLSKLGILGTQLVMGSPSDYAAGNPYETGIILANRYGSLDTDCRFVEQLDALPSPAIFVYTLPNIVTGEISIRYGFKGEQAFFVDAEMPVELLVNYVTALLDEGLIETCLMGWADVLGKHYNATLYRVSRVREDSVHSMPFNIKNVDQYNHEQGSIS